MNNIFRSQRLLYRACEAPADDEFLRSIMGDPDVSLNAINFLPRPWSVEKVVEMRKMIVEKALLYVLICKIPESQESTSISDEHGKDDSTDGQKPTPIPIGFLSIRAATESNLAHHRSGMVGITLAKEFHGNGYGPEAIKWGLDWAFKMAGLHRIGLSVYEWNPKARKVYEKLGFVTEGREREVSWFQGKWWDTINMSILDYEWEKLQNKESE
jgi:RimJ/RimL family protein N-acetyltransferase